MICRYTYKKQRMSDAERAEFIEKYGLTLYLRTSHYCDKYNEFRYKGDDVCIVRHGASDYYLLEVNGKVLVTRGGLMRCFDRIIEWCGKVEVR